MTDWKWYHYLVLVVLVAVAVVFMGGCGKAPAGPVNPPLTVRVPSETIRVPADAVGHIEIVYTSAQGNTDMTLPLGNTVILVGGGNE